MGSVPCIGVAQGDCALILTTKYHCSLVTVAGGEMDVGRVSREWGELDTNMDTYMMHELTKTDPGEVRYDQSNVRLHLFMTWIFLTLKKRGKKRIASMHLATYHFLWRSRPCGSCHTCEYVPQPLPCCPPPPCSTPGHRTLSAGTLPLMDWMSGRRRTEGQHESSPSDTTAKKVYFLMHVFLQGFYLNIVESFH